jgi:hypothetical protein
VGKQLTGSYDYFDGMTVASFECNGSAEQPQFGVGCSNGPGKTAKALPIYDKAPSLGQCTICQDTPDVFGIGACAKSIDVFVR